MHRLSIDLALGTNSMQIIVSGKNRHFLPVVFSFYFNSEYMCVPNLKNFCFFQLFSKLISRQNMHNWMYIIFYSSIRFPCDSKTLVLVFSHYTKYTSKQNNKMVRNVRFRKASIH